MPPPQPQVEGCEQRFTRSWHVARHIKQKHGKAADTYLSLVLAPPVAGGGGVTALMTTRCTVAVQLVPVVLAPPASEGPVVTTVTTTDGHYKT